VQALNALGRVDQEVTLDGPTPRLVAGSLTMTSDTDDTQPAVQVLRQTRYTPLKKTSAMTQTEEVTPLVAAAAESLAQAQAAAEPAEPPIKVVEKELASELGRSQVQRLKDVITVTGPKPAAPADAIPDKVKEAIPAVASKPSRT
jgi:hypothetical protein